MSYTSITSSEILTGKPVANTTQTKIKDNFDDHETRIEALEAGSAIAYPPIEMGVAGYYQFQTPGTGWQKFIPNFNLTITGVRLYIDIAGSSGTTEIDLLVKSGANPYASIFTTKPSLAYSAGDDAVSTNQVLDPTKVNILAGDIIRLDTTSAQDGGLSFVVRIDYTKS